MASRRAIVSTVACASRSYTTVTARALPHFSQSSRPIPHTYPTLHQTAFSCPRWSSTASATRKYTFEEIKARLPTSSPSPSLIIIDVREPGELANTGRIPGAHNIPISSAPDGLFLPPEEFSERWGFEKPEEGDKVVFYCKAGVRSRAAAGMVKGMPGGGWEGVDVGEFPGSWVEWEKNGGEIER